MSTHLDDSAHCLELAQLGNPLFGLSRVFAGEKQDLLTAIHAFFASIQNIGASLHEEEVARRKIQWWLNECRPEALAASSHPVLREIERHGAGVNCQQAMQAILVSAERRLAMTPPSDEEEFLDLCREVGSPLLDMERNLGDCAKTPDENPDGMVARRGLWWLVCESYGSRGQGRPWWLPMNLMARFGVSREVVYASLSDGESKELLKEAIKYANNNSLNSDISNYNQCDIHLLVLDTLTHKRLNKLKEKSLGSYPVVVQKTGLADLVTAWSAARKFNRRR